MRVQTFLQSEASECGLACLAAISSAFGATHELRELRLKFGQGIKGLTVLTLSQIASQLDLLARPLRVELDELAQVNLPCIIHMDLNHFVVLDKVGRHFQIMDPAVGPRRIDREEMSRRFSGVAVEFMRSESFKPKRPPRSLSIGQLTGKVVGLKRAMGQVFLLALFLEAINLATPLMAQLIVDDVLVSGDHDLLVIIIVGYALLLIFQAIVSYGRSWVLLTIGQRFNLQWASNVFSHLVQLPATYFEKRHVGDIASRFSSIRTIQTTLTTAAVEGVLDGLMAVATLVMMFLISAKLAAVVLVAAIVYGVFRGLMLGWMRASESGRLIVAARESSHFIETLRTIAPLRLFDRMHERRARWQSHVVEIQNHDASIARMTILSNGVNRVIFGVENLVIFWLGAKMILAGPLPGGDLFTTGVLLSFVGYKSQFSARATALIDFIIRFRMLDLNLARLSDIVLEPVEKDDVPFNALGHLEPVIELRNVSFRYASGERWILRGVNLKIDAGQYVAISGPSGTGKSTLMRLITGLLQPVEGEVLYGGVPIRQLGLRNFRRMLGTVAQDDPLMAGTIAENISFFDPEADTHEIERCARLAQLNDDIRRMPMGYHTLIGELGSGLSGGQKQRLCLARALYKQPRALVLDEATSHLDAASEQRISEAIAGLDLTRVVIAHRSETLATAQRVVELVNGKLREAAVPAMTMHAPVIKASRDNVAPFPEMAVGG
jgi:ATP-binding cassette subfamily B protein RaxB